MHWCIRLSKNKPISSSPQLSMLVALASTLHSICIPHASQHGKGVEPSLGTLNYFEDDAPENAVSDSASCSFKIPHMPPVGSLKVLHAPARRGGIRRASQTKIYNLETGE